MMLPCLAASSSNDAGRRAPAWVPDRSTDEAPRARVLVVEDEWLVAVEIEAVLEDEGFEVVGVAASADEAVRLAGAHAPDIVLMDIRIRGRSDGVSAALEIRRRFGLRSLFISAHRDPATQERAQAADPLGWVTKPFSGRQLIDAIAAALPAS
jgi:two-component system, response regulator PdtaR